jgi:hypothetical protein
MIVLSAPKKYKKDIKRISEKPPAKPATVNKNCFKGINSFTLSKYRASRKYKIKKAIGMIALLTQYFKKGFELVAKKRNRPLCKINVVISQLIINIPVATPVIAPPAAFTFPKYSGARNKVFAPNEPIKCPETVRKSISHKIKSTCDFLKCSSSNWMGNE